MRYGIWDVGSILKFYQRRLSFKKWISPRNGCCISYYGSLEK